MIALNSSTRPDENPMKILHLEDSLLDHQLTCKALEPADNFFEIVRVDSLNGFRLAMTSHAFDVVVADYHLPGFTAIDAWNIMPSDRTIPFVLLSGAIGEAAAVRAIQLGMSDYLHKDDVSSIGRVILRAIDVHRIRRAKEAVDRELLDSKSRLAQFANHLQDTIESERASIAREIHDDIGGSLAAVRLDLSWIARHALQLEIVAKTTTAASMVQHALEASQRIMHDLRPAILDQGLFPAAMWLAEQFERRTGIKVEKTGSQIGTNISTDIQLAAYRTIQEAFTNIAKHTNCKLVKLEITDFDNFLTVDIADDGQGFSKEEMLKVKAFGLRGLIERARAVGGWLDISSQPGKGTTIILSVPLRKNAAHNPGKEIDD